MFFLVPDYGKKSYSHSENKTHKNIQPREVIFFPLFCQFRCLYVCFISSVLSCLLFGKSCCLYVCLFLLFCLAFIFVSLALSVSVCDSFVRLVAFLLFFPATAKGRKRQRIQSFLVKDCLFVGEETIQVDLDRTRD